MFHDFLLVHSLFLFLSFYAACGFLQKSSLWDIQNQTRLQRIPNDFCSTLHSTVHFYLSVCALLSSLILTVSSHLCSERKPSAHSLLFKIKTTITKPIELQRGNIQSAPLDIRLVPSFITDNFSMCIVVYPHLRRFWACSHPHTLTSQIMLSLNPHSVRHWPETAE